MADHVSRGAARVLQRDARCCVHSSFTHTMNVRVGRGLVMLAPEGRPEPEDCPFGIEVTAGDWRRIREGLRSGALSSRWRWDSSSGRFTAGRSTVLRVSPHRHPQEVARPAREAPAPVVTALPALPGDAPLPGLLRHHTVGEVLGRLRSARDALTGRGAVEEVLWLIGRGPGLTPSGDDAVVGLLAAVISTGGLDPEAAGAVTGMLEQRGTRLTTDVSLAYLDCALRGEFGRSVTDVIAALGDPDTLGPAVQRLARHGHTSGVDLLLGLIIGLEPATSQNED